MINPNAYYTVQGWMLSELGLKGNALAVYAIIYGFSQDGVSEYAGSSRYLCEWLGCSKKTVLTALADLTERGLLIKTTTCKNGQTTNSYVVAKMVNGPGVKITPGVEKNLHRGGEKITPNNTRDNTSKINIEINKEAPAAPTASASEVKKDKKPVKHKCGAFGHVLLSDAEYAKLEADYGADMVIAAVKYLDEYIEEKGYKSKSHNLAIRRWVIDAVKERQQKKAQGYRPARNGQAAGPVGPNGIALDPTKTDLDGMF